RYDVKWKTRAGEADPAGGQRPAARAGWRRSSVMRLFRSLKRLPVNEMQWFARNGDHGQIRWRGAGFTVAQASLVARDLAWLRAVLVAIDSDLAAYEANPLTQARVERWFGAGVTKAQVAEVAA